MQTRTSGMGSKGPGRNWSVKRLLGAGALLLSLCLGAGQAWAAAGPNDPPIYNPASKSYFQILTHTSRKENWIFAHRTALSRFYKGARGRLAVIDRPETHQFILQNFDLKFPLWIGLRYWCSFRMLQWNGLRPYSPSDSGHFQAWHPQWYRNPQSICSPDLSGEKAYMPFYYEPLGRRNARWQASGPGKGFVRFLVEYPTGEE